MLKKTLISLLFVSLLLTACGKVDLGFGEKDPVSLAVIEMDDLVAGLPSELPEGLSIPESVNTDQVYVDASITSNFFYDIDESQKTVTSFYKESLAEASWELLFEKEMNNYNSLQFKKGLENLKISIYKNVPASYPSKLDLKGTFVTVLYNFDTPSAP